MVRQNRLRVTSVTRARGSTGRHRAGHSSRATCAAAEIIRRRAEGRHAHRDPLRRRSDLCRWRRRVGRRPLHRRHDRSGGGSSSRCLRRRTAARPSSVTKIHTGEWPEICFKDLPISSCDPLVVSGFARRSLGRSRSAGWLSPLAQGFSPAGALPLRIRPSTARARAPCRASHRGVVARRKVADMENVQGPPKSKKRQRGDE